MCVTKNAEHSKIVYCIEVHLERIGVFTRISFRRTYRKEKRKCDGGSSVPNHKTILGSKYLYFKRAAVFCLGHRLSKHEMTRYARNLGGLDPLDTLMDGGVDVTILKCFFYSKNSRRSLIVFLPPLFFCWKVVEKSQISKSRWPLPPAHDSVMFHCLLFDPSGKYKTWNFAAILRLKSSIDRASGRYTMLVKWLLPVSLSPLSLHVSFLKYFHLFSYTLPLNCRAFFSGALFYEALKYRFLAFMFVSRRLCQLSL